LDFALEKSKVPNVQSALSLHTTFLYPLPNSAYPTQFAQLYAINGNFVSANLIYISYKRSNKGDYFIYKSFQWN